MPREDRRIIFSNDEVYKALYALATQKQMKKLPPGQIAKIYEDTADETIVYFEIENLHDEGAAKMDYSRDFLAAALMLFCRGVGIPLPKSATKSVMISNDNEVILRVQI